MSENVENPPSLVSTQLPKPIPNSAARAKMTNALFTEVLGSLIPGASVTGALFEYFIETKQQRAVQILMEKISEGQVQLLHDPDYEGLIPNVFSYLEAAQRGEYEHNLEIIARLLVNQTILKSSDPGAIRRASRRLEALDLEGLKLPVSINELFRIKEYGPQKNAPSMIDTELLDYCKDKHMIDLVDINCYLSEFLSRGLLYVASHAEYIGGIFYYRTKPFIEIFDAAGRLSSR